MHRTRQRDGAVDYHRRDPCLSVDPDRHARSGQGLDPAFAFARRGLVRDQPNVNPAFLREDQRSDGPRAGRQAIGADQDLALGVVDGANRQRCAIFLGSEANCDGRLIHRGGRQDGSKRGKGQQERYREHAKVMLYKN